MSRRGELYIVLAATFAELAQLEGDPAVASQPPAPRPRSRDRARPLVCDDGRPVDELSTMRAAKALARYPQ